MQLIRFRSVDLVLLKTIDAKCNFIALVSGISRILLKMTWDESSGLRDGTYRSAGGLLSLVEPAKKAPLGYGPRNASQTVKSKEGLRER